MVFLSDAFIRFKSVLVVTLEKKFGEVIIEGANCFCAHRGDATTKIGTVDGLPILVMVVLYLFLVLEQ